MKYNIYRKIKDNMTFNIYQIIGAIIYIIVSVIIIFTIWFLLQYNMFWLFKVFLLLFMVILIPTPFYALVFLLNGVLGSLLPVKEKEYNKKDEKYVIKNDFTSMFESVPKKKE